MSKRRKKSDPRQPEQIVREIPEKDLRDLQHEEFFGSSYADRSLAQSETDEDEKEGLGDGNIGRSTRDVLPD